MSVQNIIDDTTGKIASSYLPATHQNGITQITTGTPNDIILTSPSANVVNIDFSQEPTVQTINATQQIRLGDELLAIADEVIIDQTGITITNGDLTIENATDQAILQAGTGDRLLVNAAVVAYTSEIPTVALTAGSNVTITNNTVGNAYSFQVSATGEVGVQSVSAGDSNIVISGTGENPTVGLASDISVDKVILSEITGPATVDITAANGYLEVDGNALAFLSDIPGNTSITAGTNISVANPSTNTFTITNTQPNTAITAGTNISVANPSTNTFTITNTQPNTAITAGTGISVTNPSTNAFTIANSGVTQLTGGAGVSVSGSTGNITVANTGVLAVNAGTGIQVSGLQSSRQVAIANIGTAGTYAYPTSITTNAQGQVSSISAGPPPLTTPPTLQEVCISGNAVSGPGIEFLPPTATPGVFLKCFNTEELTLQSTNAGNPATLTMAFNGSINTTTMTLGGLPLSSSSGRIQVSGSPNQLIAYLSDISGGAGVQSVTAGSTNIVIGGTATNPTVNLATNPNIAGTLTVSGSTPNYFNAGVYAPGLVVNNNFTGTGNAGVAIVTPSTSVAQMTSQDGSSPCQLKVIGTVQLSSTFGGASVATLSTANNILRVNNVNVLTATTGMQYNVSTSTVAPGTITLTAADFYQTRLYDLSSTGTLTINLPNVSSGTVPIGSYINIGRVVNDVTPGASIVVQQSFAAPSITISNANQIVTFILTGYSSTTPLYSCIGGF